MEHLSEQERLGHKSLVDLVSRDDWRANADHLQSALALLREHPSLAKYPIWFNLALRHILDCRDVAIGDIQSVIDIMHPEVIHVDFLHYVCWKDFVSNRVVKFFATKFPEAISTRRPSIPEGYPIAFFWERCCRSSGRVPLEAASNDYWKEVQDMCDLLWVDGEDQFVHRAVEVECWPLVSYFVSKVSKDYWIQTGSRRWWNYRPPVTRTLSLEALDIIDKLVLPKCQRKAIEFELLGNIWNDQQIFLPWIQNHPHLQELSLKSMGGVFGGSTTDPPFTEALLESLTQNQNLEILQLTGAFQANWDPFVRLLLNAPKDLCMRYSVLLSQENQSYNIEHCTPTNPPSNLQILELFDIRVHPQSLLDLLKVLASLPFLKDLELIPYPPEGESFDMQETTRAVIHLLEQGRLQCLNFGPCLLELLPMCKHLRENTSLQTLEGYFDSQDPEDFQELLSVIKDHNRTLQCFAPVNMGRVGKLEA